MTTERQIEANRQNAQASTGPRTAEGKAKVSRNAEKHGLFSRHVVIEGEDPDEFEAFATGMRRELAPAGDLQDLIADRIHRRGLETQTDRVFRDSCACT